jgi:hypothetical protein
MNRAADDPTGQARLKAFQQALQQLGWSDGRNVRIDDGAGGKNILFHSEKSRMTPVIAVQLVAAS